MQVAKRSLDLIFAALLFSGTAWAHGQAVICQKTTGQETVESLLVYESRVAMQGLTVDLGAPTLSIGDKAAMALDRLVRDPDRRDRWKKEAARFTRRILPEQKPLGLTDKITVPMEPGCRVEQVMYVEPGYGVPAQKIYHVQAALWNRMSADSRASLIVHECVLTEIYHQSDATRYFAESLLSVRTIEEMTTENYVALLRTVGFSSYKVGAAKLGLGGKFVFDPAGRIEIVTALRPGFLDLDRQWRVWAIGDIIFYPDKMILKSLRVSHDDHSYHYHTRSHAFLGGTDCRLYASSQLSFHPDGSLAHVGFYNCGTDPIFTAGDQSIPAIGTGDYATFYPNGSLSCLAGMKHSMKLKTKAGIQMMTSGRAIAFDTDGNASYVVQSRCP